MEAKGFIIEVNGLNQMVQRLSLPSITICMYGGLEHYALWTTYQMGMEAWSMETTRHAARLHFLNTRVPRVQWLD